MSKGWIPAWRKLFEREDWMRPTKRNPASYIHAWLDLCQMAQHKDGHDQGGVRLEEGEVLVAVRTLADRWGWSKSAVSRFVKRAKRDTMIGTVRGTPQGTVYRIVKYEDYAIPEKHSRDTSRDDSRDSSGTAAGQEQQLTINKQQTDRGVSKAAARLPEGWSPTAEHIERAKESGLDVIREADKFRAHAVEKDRRAKVWNAAFTRWLINAEEYAKRNGTERQTSSRGFWG